MCGVPLSLLQLLLLLTLSAAMNNDVFMKKYDMPAAAEDPCYEYGTARKCIPDFVNAAYGAPVVASSTCGQEQPQRYCEFQDPRTSGKLVCDSCDAANPQRSFAARALTDLNNSNNVTCWRSAPIAAATALSGAAADNVTLMLSLGKTYELTYVSLQFCPLAPKPESIAIYKSSDYGHSWQPFQYYSSQCRRVFGKMKHHPVSKQNEQEARCSDLHRHGSDALGGSAGRIAFSILDGRPSAGDVDGSQVLQDWVTATNIKVVFQRLQLPNLGGDLKSGKYSVQLAGNNIEQQTAAGGGLDGSLLGLHYAVSDFTVGGRCKCNGHASRCVPDAKGQLTCECRHNTVGRDCETCKRLYFDKPWGRATAQNANECKKCNCNNHARRCKFSMEVFRLTRGVSGGVCQNCRHSTTGRNCEECQDGFYRDAKKPLTHHKVCKACNCHPSGSSGKICNSTTGQCACKEGVTGLTCNRCDTGYQLSSSHIAPCIKQRAISVFDTQNTAPEEEQEQEEAEYEEPNGMAAVAAPVASAHVAVATQAQPYYRNAGGRACKKCKISTKRLNLNKFCKRDYAIMAKVIGRETSSEAASSERYTINGHSSNNRHAMYREMGVEDYEMDQAGLEYEYQAAAAGYGSHNIDQDYQSDRETAHFDLQIQAVFKRTKAAYGMPNTMLRPGPMTWIIPIKNLECRCPKIKVNQSYLILGRDLEAPSGYLGIGPSSIVIEWEKDWSRRLRRFKRRARSCA